MDPIGRIILYEMRFNTSWAQWNALRRAIAMYDAIGNSDRKWLSGFSNSLFVMHTAGASIWKMVVAPTDKLADLYIRYLDPSAVAIAALALATDPVNRGWTLPADPVGYVKAAVRKKGGAEAFREVAGWGGGSFGSFLRVFRACPEGVSEPIARLAQPLGIHVPPPRAAHSEVLRSILLINDGIPENTILHDGQAERALTPQAGGALLRAVVQLHKGEPGRWRSGLLSSVPERLAAENPAAVRPHLAELFDAGIVSPEFIYHDAPPDFITRLEGMARENSNSCASGMLAATRRPTLDDPECPRISDDCRALPRRKEGAFPSEQPLHAVVDDIGLPCPRCSRRLLALIDLQLRSPQLHSYAARLPASATASGFQRLRVVACEQCSGEGMYICSRQTPSGEIIPDSIRMGDSDSAFRAIAIEHVALDSRKEWTRDAIRFDPTPRQPTAPLVYALGYGGASHLGGFPKWTQDPEPPACPTCEKRMPFLAHVCEGDLGSGDADLFAFWCPKCLTTAVVPQQS